jgi:hypothetical protein
MVDGENSRSKNKKLKKLEENKVVFKTQGANLLLEFEN